MEESTIRDQSAISGNGGKSKLQRYPLRSANKTKEEKVESANSSAARRAKPPSSVSKSMGVLDLSAKEKSTKPPRRLSVPSKSNVNSTPKLVGNITPIAEARSRRSANTRAKSETPLSDASRSSTRKKFSVLSSASYWLQQIKLSESAAKHSISLGFFKLALEAGSEPPQKMREELKSYAQRHDLAELKETLKELFESYNIVDNPEQLQVSESISQVPEEGSRSSDDEVRSSSSSIGARKLKPKALNTDAAVASKVAEPAKETQKKNPAIKVRDSANRNSARSKSVPDNGTKKIQKKVQKPTKEESNIEKDKVKRQGKKPAAEEGPDATLPLQDEIENKENMDNQPEEVPAEVM